MKKPVANFTGQDGNIFNLVGIAIKALKKAGQGESIKEMSEKVFSASSYAEAISIMSEYVEVR